MVIFYIAGGIESHPRIIHDDLSQVPHQYHPRLFICRGNKCSSPEPNVRVSRSESTSLTLPTRFSITVTGIDPPTATNASIVAAYEDAEQKCGPDLTAALHWTALSSYINETSPTNNPNVTDPGFLQWAGLNSVDYQYANNNCMQAKLEYLRVDDVDQTHLQQPTNIPTLGVLASSAAPIVTNVGGNSSGTRTTTAKTTTDTGGTGSIRFTSSAVIFDPSLLVSLLVGLLVGNVLE